MPVGRLDLASDTGRIAQGDFENHLPENRRDEIGQLSVSINRMAERLSGFVTGQKRFLGDIAHELSAPIARIQFALGILEQRASEPPQGQHGDDTGNRGRVARERGPPRQSGGTHERMGGGERHSEISS